MGEWSWPPSPPVHLLFSEASGRNYFSSFYENKQIPMLSSTPQLASSIVFIPRTRNEALPASRRV